MEALAGFVVGYLVGTRSGREGLRELRESWKVVSASEEFQGMTATARSMAGMVLHQGMRAGVEVAKGNSGGAVSLLTDRLQTVIGGGSNGRKAA